MKNKYNIRTTQVKDKIQYTVINTETKRTYLITSSLKIAQDHLTYLIKEQFDASQV